MRLWVIALALSLYREHKIVHGLRLTHWLRPRDLKIFQLHRPFNFKSSKKVIYSEVDRGSALLKSRNFGQNSEGEVNIRRDWWGFTKISWKWHRLIVVALSACLGIFGRGGKVVLAAGGGLSIQASQSRKLTPLLGMVIWCLLFILSAALHSAEAAMTKISPFRAREIAEEEGKDPLSNLIDKPDTAPEHYSSYHDYTGYI